MSKYKDVVDDAARVDPTDPGKVAKDIADKYEKSHFAKKQKKLKGWVYSALQEMKKETEKKTRKVVEDEFIAWCKEHDIDHHTGRKIQRRAESKTIDRSEG